LHIHFCSALRLGIGSFKVIHVNITAQNKYGNSLNDFRITSFLELHPKEEKQLIALKFTAKEDKTTENYFIPILNNSTEIKVEIYLREIQNSSNGVLIVQSNDIAENLNHITTIEVQNTKLKKIVWTKSHTVRAPISRILAIINLIEGKEENFSEMLFWIP
jgi:nitrogen-specific signal transduction histidine kinase